MFTSEADVENARAEIATGQVSVATCTHIVDEIMTALEGAKLSDGGAAEELAGELVSAAALKYGFAESEGASDAIWVKANVAVDEYLLDEFGG